MKQKHIANKSICFSLIKDHYRYGSHASVCKYEMAELSWGLLISIWSRRKFLYNYRVELDKKLKEVLRMELQQRLLDAHCNVHSFLFPYQGKVSFLGINTVLKLANITSPSFPYRQK